MSKLFVVPTPIGNLEDITLRAINTLKQVDVILAEDTRKTRILLQHYAIEKRVIAYHKFNEHKTLHKLIEIIQENNSVALVSDAGTPGISDPGFLLIRECILQQIDVCCLPGATAFVPALVNSGLPSDRFVFEGFLPFKKGRQTRLKSLAEENRTIILYESPHRIVSTVEQLIEYFGKERQIVISRELSKIFEENIRGTLQEVLEILKNRKTQKGEFVIIINGKEN